MQYRFATLLALVATLLSSPVLAQAPQEGTVTVSFHRPERFADAGRNPREVEANLKQLAEHLKQLGRQLPPSDRLEVTVLDVDLAGRVKPGSPSEPRLVTGGADWPTIRLRYSLSSHGQTVRQGDEWLSDMNYTMNAGSIGANDPLTYEKRLLEQWFVKRVAPHGIDAP